MLGYLSSRLDYDTASGFYREALTRAHALGRLDLADEISREAGLVAFPVEPTRNPQPATLEDAAQMLQCNLVSMGVETSELIELLTDEKVCALV
jgi:hypothetical protein